MQIEAQEALLEISISSYPHSKTTHQQKLHKQLHKQAYPKDKEPMTLDKLEQYLRAHGG